MYISNTKDNNKNYLEVHIHTKIKIKEEKLNKIWKSKLVATIAGRQRMLFFLLD